ncbi:hypothetical protein I1A62_00230 (plasmid) [Rhodococcus sp. USK10]|nr:hypothetical protein I1A62_00230 [Rhodococcus sp. USK10]
MERGLHYTWYRFDTPPSEERIDGKSSYSRLFHAGDIDFPDLIDRWHNLTGVLHGALDMLLGIEHEPSGYYENKLFNSASALEAFHREFFPDSTDIDRAEFDRVRLLIKNALPKSDRDVLKRFNNNPGYVKRCEEIAQIPDEQAVHLLLGDTRQWATWLKNARNDLAHNNPPEQSKVPYAVWYYLAPVTIALLHLVLMEKLGLPPDAQRRAVERGALEIAAYGYKAAKRRLVADKSLIRVPDNAS